MMRIIAGEFKGRKLIPPGSDATRPITDRAKQSLFDVIAPLLPEEIVYDCFAGTGSMGLESLSRGASHVTFFERDREAVQRLKRNIEAIGMASQSKVVSGDLFRWFDDEKMHPKEPERAAIIFLDPPYRFVRERADAVRKLAESMARHHLRPDGTLIFRHDAADSLELAGMTRYDQRSYGQMTIELLRPAQ